MKSQGFYGSSSYRVSALMSSAARSSVSLILGQRGSALGVLAAHHLLFPIGAALDLASGLSRGP